jgi:hydrogenase nickel incorporation protein HypB
MCDTCGCSQPADAVTIRKPGEEHHHHTHSHDHGHSHEHGSDHHHHDHGTVVDVNQDLMAQNNRLAERNRGYFEAKNIKSYNLVSSPGSGKTTLLEKTITALKDKVEIAVIEGDQQTLNDADRINATGAPVVQVNTGNGCHLDADMVHRSFDQLPMAENSILFIENVGNLVCPSLFDLGEEQKIVVMSVTEGDDKALKYPTMFQASQTCVINKIDLLPYVDFEVARFKEYALKINPKLHFFEVSAKTGEGMETWLNWLSKDKVS